MSQWFDSLNELSFPSASSIPPLSVMKGICWCLLPLWLTYFWPGRVCDSLALEWHKHTAHMVVSLTLKSWGFFEYMVGDQFLTALAPKLKQYNACFQYKRECRVEADGYSDIASGDAMIAMKILMKYIQLLKQKTNTFQSSSISTFLCLSSLPLALHVIAADESKYLMLSDHKIITYIIRNCQTYFNFYLSQTCLL